MFEMPKVNIIKFPEIKSKTENAIIVPSNKECKSYN